ncbi:MAG: hypothetical protein QNJ16_09945 [Rhodobacter sp.]|nr:hypothetical protein [Rhodobacter sp.]
MIQLRSFLLVAGAYTFAYCIGLIFHEYGHSAIQWMGGLPDTQIHLHPFDMSYIAHDESAGFPPQSSIEPIHAIAGSCLNRLLAVLILLVVWRFRNPYLLPVLIIPGTSFLMEGVGMIVDLAMGENDWDIFMSLTGTPLIAMIWLILIVLSLGIVFMCLVMPLAGIRHDATFLRRLGPFLGVAAFFALSLLYILILGSKYRNTAHVIEARAIALVGSFALVLEIAVLYRPLHAAVRRVTSSEVATIAWTHSLSALSAGALVAISMIATY